jgi:integrase
VRQRLHSILDFALESGLIPGNPLPAVRRRPLPAKNHPTVTTREGVGAILRAVDAANPEPSIARAHALLVFTAQRINNVTSALWEEFDLDAGVWTIPRSKMKARKRDRGPHLVPLPPRLLAQLRQWHAADGDGAAFVCPGIRGGDTLSDTKLQDFYRDDIGLRGKHRPHSWRSLLKTWAADAGKSTEAVEQQLDHSIGNATTVAYDRADRLGPRRELMTWYESELIAARDGAAVVDLRTRKKI